jgi:hypothetical protein
MGLMGHMVLMSCLRPAPTSIEDEEPTNRNQYLSSDSSTEASAKAEASANEESPVTLPSPGSRPRAARCRSRDNRRLYLIPARP